MCNKQYTCTQVAVIMMVILLFQYLSAVIVMLMLLFQYASSCHDDADIPVSILKSDHNMAALGK